MESRSEAGAEAAEPAAEAPSTAAPIEAAPETATPEAATPTRVAPRLPVDRPRTASAGATPAPPPADLVVGSVEVELRGGRYVPGEHFQVVLRDGRRSFDAITDRNGEFYLEDVPAGRYVLTLAPLKGSVFLTDTVSVAGGSRVRLEHIHVPAAALRGGAGSR